MVELIIGKKGSGKTKQLIENVNSAVSVAKGNVVFISNSNSRNMYDISTKVRMADTSEFEIKSYAELLGFISGIVSGNFDITNIFIVVNIIIIILLANDDCCFCLLARQI